MGSSRLSPAHPRRAERLVLFLGLASGAVMLAALQLASRPGSVGRLAMDEAARRVSIAVTDEWRQLVRNPDRWLDFDPNPVHWTAADESRPARAPQPEPAEASGSFAAFDALLDQAEHRELTEGNLESAWTTTLAALELPCDGERRARGRLRAIQLACRLGDRERALGQWRAACAEGSGMEQDGRVSCLLLGALAMGPLLSDGESAEAQDHLVSLWMAGSLALPAGASTRRDDSQRLVVEVSVEIEVLSDGLRELSTDGEDDRIAHLLEVERARALELVMGELPLAPADGSLGLTFLDRDVLAYFARPGGQFEGTILTDTGLRKSLAHHLRALPFFPQGFHVDLEGDAEALGDAVSPQTALWGDEIGFTVRHEDPQAFMRGEERRLDLVRGSLAVLAAFTFLAGVLSFQALRRQRVLHELKGRFVASVSHELRTPITGILLATENIADGRARTPQRLERYHGLIRQEAHRLQRLVDDVLDFSRLERGDDAHLRVESVPLGPYFGNLVTEARSRVEHAGLAFDASVRLDVQQAAFDREAIRRAIANLVDNALRHSGSERIVMSITVDNEVVIRVDDYGRGIPAKLHKSIFEPFHQVGGEDGSSMVAAGSTGLGLAIVNEICRGHGGTARCQALDQGTGTRFELRLPVRSAPTHGESNQ